MYCIDNFDVRDMFLFTMLFALTVALTLFDWEHK